MNICEYGCNNEAKFKFKNGKFCCSEKQHNCIEVRRKNSLGQKNSKNKGRFKKDHEVSKELRLKFRLDRLGKPNIHIVGDKNPTKRKEVIEKIKIKRILANNYKLSKETINKISSKNKGRKHSEESKLNMRLCKLGDKNPAWTGGSFDPYCPIFSNKDFKQMIKDRDGHRCLNPYCNKKSKILDIHHINYDKQECDSMNLITICKSCNASANANREWHKEWYSTIIKKRYCK